LDDGGWDALTLTAVADRAGVSRATAWRQLSSKEALVTALLRQLADDYRETLWPVLTATTPSVKRLRRALYGLCDVADRHLPLLLASDVAFHQAHDDATIGAQFSEPLIRLLHDGVADGSVALRPDECERRGELLFNAVCWPYVHLRGRHGWPADAARGPLVDMLLAGLVNPQTPTTEGSQ
jgi:AcrR family transcriptional regulator